MRLSFNTLAHFFPGKALPFVSASRVRTCDDQNFKLITSLQTKAFTASQELLQGYCRSAFISLYLLQALVFITGFCGTIVYKIQRISSAHCSRVQALSDRSFLKSIYPFVLAQLDNVPLPIEQALMTGSINMAGDTKNLLVECIRKTDHEKVVSIVLLNSAMQVKSTLYLFFTKARDERAWKHQGVQFGNSL